MTNSMPIPPLEPTWYQDGGGIWPNQNRSFDARTAHMQVIFKMSMEDYRLRMAHESIRLEREHQAEEQLKAKTQIISDLRAQVETLQMSKTPTIPALKQAYAEGDIDLDTFDRLVLHCLAV